MLGASFLLFLVPKWQFGSRFVLNSAKPEIYNIDVTEQHPKTVEIALKHCETYQTYADKSKCASHTLAAFLTATTFVNEFYQSQPVNDRKFVILDSGCGAGMSTVCLAKLYPDIPIIGIDRSIARLSRNKKLAIKDPSAVLTQNQNGVVDVDVDVQGNLTGATSESVMSPRELMPVDNVSMLEMLENGDTSEEEDENSEAEAETSIQLMSNAILLRAELSDFFTLVAYESDWVVHSHYLLYPNPYPKGKHLKRRWHGHPIFPVMLSIGRPHHTSPHCTSPHDTSSLLSSPHLTSPNLTALHCIVLHCVAEHSIITNLLYV
jgi:tRNA G46 methylase TrmB